MDYILRLKTITIADVAEVGVKNAFLGEVFTHKALNAIRVPDGFVITASAFRHFIAYNKLDGVHDHLISQIDPQDPASVGAIGKQARELILGARIPGDLHDSIIIAYNELVSDSTFYNALAVRSSALDNASSAINTKDKYDTFLNVRGENELIQAIKKCFASLYSDQALIEVPVIQGRTIAVGVQHMVQAEQACSGFAFTSDPESGFEDVIQISGVRGNGLDKASPSSSDDEFIVYKPNLHLGIKSIIQKKQGTTSQHWLNESSKSPAEGMAAEDSLVSPEKYILTDEEILIIADWGILLETHYQSPMSMKWAKDSASQDLFMLQAKPENFNKFKLYKKSNDQV